MELRTSGQINMKIRGTEQGKKEINRSGEWPQGRDTGTKTLMKGVEGTNKPPEELCKEE